MKNLLITLKWAQSFDGQLADDDNCSQWISGAEERVYTHQLRSEQNGILVGAQTFLKDQCQLTVRDVPHTGAQPVRIIIDPRGRISEVLKETPDFFSSDPTHSVRRTFLVSGSKVPLSISQDDPNLVFISAPLGTLSFEEWLEPALQKLSWSYELLEKKYFNALMVEGGAAVLSAFLKAGLADRIEVAISPVLLGGKKNRVSVDWRLRAESRWNFESSEKLGNDILLRYSSPLSREKINLNLRSPRHVA